MGPRSTPRLLFSNNALVRNDLSAVCASGDNLWLASDEGTFIERLTHTAPDTYERHARFDLSKLLDLPVKNGEVDIEGLDVDAGYLWLVGSHSLKRKKHKRGDKAAANIDRFAKTEADGNRYMLARIPLMRDESGDFALSLRHGALRAAQIAGNERGSDLLDELRDDPHIAPFLPRKVRPDGKKNVIGVPGKENGLDIEGLAVCGGRVFLGLRGPVLRGWAIVLELMIQASENRLNLQRIGSDGQRYRKHFLELDGLGVREIAVDGNDLLILAGPTLNLDGPVAIYRWEDALDATGESFIPREDLKMVLKVPYGQGKHRGRDHAEGVLRLSKPGAARTRILIVYDSPASDRYAGDFGVHADVFDLATAELSPPKAEK